MTNVVILGGGFGGVRTALDLDKKLGDREDVKVTLIDKNAGQIFYPALYELASIYGMKRDDIFNSKKKKLVEIPFSKIFKNTCVDFIQAEIENINISQKFVATSGGTIIDFDYLVMGLGTTSSDFGIPGVKEYAFPFKNTDDALMVNEKLYQLMDEAAKGYRKLPIKIVIGGGGFTGIELASELVSCGEHIAHNSNVHFDGCVSVMILEAAPKILPMISDAERVLVSARLEKLGIQIMENSPIAEVKPNSVVLKNNQNILADITIWSTGAVVPQIIFQIHNLDLNEQGRIKVNQFLQTNHENIFALGDCVIVIDAKTQRPVPQMAYTAIEQGKIIAENIYRKISGRKVSTHRPLELTQYKPTYGTWVAPVGGKYAVAHLGQGRTYDGFLGYLIREVVDLRYYLSVLPFLTGIKLFLKDISSFSKND